MSKRYFTLPARFVAAAFTALTLLVSTLSPHAAFAEQGDASGGKHRIYGGGFTDARTSPLTLVKLIRNGQYVATCSGMLVSPELVLTAAHCIVDEQGRGYDFQVVVGGNVFTPSFAYYSSSYRPNGAVDTANSKYDLGMLVLQFGVTNVQPMPVWYDYDFLAFPKDVTIGGFGANNEGYNAPGLEPYNLAKSASYSLIATQDEMLLGSFQPHASSPCPGDSGGPVISEFSYLGRILENGLLGVTSLAPVYYDENGRCVVAGNFAYFVDLRTPSSVGFLNAFTGVRRVSARNAYIKYLAISLGSHISATVWQVNSLRDIKKYSVGLLPSAQTLSIFAQDVDRTKLVNRINGRFRAVRRALTAKAAKGAIRAVVRLCDSLAAMGVG
jgi:V8-like Glu-specific endopeptidase